MAVTTATTAAPPAYAGSTADWRDWLKLMKPRVVSLVVFTGAMGLAIAPGHLNPVLTCTAVLCIAVAAGACGAINMWYDRDIDAIMERTKHRPLVTGAISARAALVFAVGLEVAAFVLLWLAREEHESTGAAPAAGAVPHL